MSDSIHSRDTLRSTLQLIWMQTDGYALRRFGLSLIGVILSAALSALTPLIFKLIIDAFSAVTPVTGYLPPAALITGYVLGQFLVRSTGELRAFVHGQAVQRLNRNLSQQLFKHILHLPLRFHLDRKTGGINETLGQGLNGCQTLLQHLVYTFLPVAFEFLAVTLVLIHFGHAMYLIIFAVSGVAYAVAFWRGAADVITPAKEVSTARIDAHAVLTDSLLNCETVKYFGAEGDVAGRYEHSQIRIESTWRHFLRFRLFNGLFVTVIFTLSLAASLGVAGYEVLHHQMTIGDFVLINSYIVRLMQPLETIGFAIRDVSQSLAFVRKMLDMFAEPAESDLATAQANSFVTRGELTFGNVTFSYDTQRTILRDISFTVPAGRTTAIVGTSGSGKSSIIRLLFRLYEPSEGRILLDGIPVTDLPMSVLRQSIAIVPQDTMLFNDTIGKNIGFGRRDATRQDIEKAATLAHLHHFIAGLEQGYDTPVGERGLKLSGGEKQRVAIARAALKSPRIFIFDEATSSLDSQTEREILHNLMEVARASTTLIIAHRLSTVIHADEIIVLQQGVIVERGTHALLLERNGSYAALWRAQQTGRARLNALETPATTSIQ